MTIQTAFNLTIACKHPKEIKRVVSKVKGLSPHGYSNCFQTHYPKYETNGRKNQLPTPPAPLLSLLSSYSTKAFSRFTSFVLREPWLVRKALSVSMYSIWSNKTKHNKTLQNNKTNKTQLKANWKDRSLTCFWVFEGKIYWNDTMRGPCFGLLFLPIVRVNFQVAFENTTHIKTFLTPQETVPC